MKRDGIVGIAAILIIFAYVGLYAHCRATHVIGHYSNANHPDPAKRQPGHYVSLASESGGAHLVGIVFKPAMMLEESWRNLMD